ncbi:MAG: hypothetical protein U0Y96_10880 [Candidatus Kapaibacterium sp.]
MYEKIQEIITLFVKEEYRLIEELTGGVNLKAIEIEQAVREYGRTVVEPPITIQELVEMVKVESDLDCKWNIVVPFYTSEEGRSDLSLELTIELKDSNFIVELNDIHVL